ncbi:MAG: osmoprotectant NAGGN system M42 family peptidase [Desulfofustis sp.]
MTDIDQGYLLDILSRLVEIPSPSGMTDEVVRLVCGELDNLDIPYELTRRGAIRAAVSGRISSPSRALVAHLDTLGAMVKTLKASGRLGIVPVGTWSSRFAEGGRVLVHSDGSRKISGTVLPLKASGHCYNEEVDEQPVSWENLEIRLDEVDSSPDRLWELGVRVGDYVSFEPGFEIHENGYINSRFLDDKAGVAAMLAAARALNKKSELPTLDSSLLFTISEEVGIGASHTLTGDVAEMVTVDNGTIDPNQNSCEFGATVAMMDSSGPFDLHLTRHLVQLCLNAGIEFSRDIFLHYRSDAAAALEAGNDIRTALVCFGLDASHGYERTHISSLVSVARLLAAYLGSAPLFAKDENVIGPEREYPLIDLSSERRPR